MSDHYKSVLQQTLEAFYEISIREIDRIKTGRTTKSPLPEKRLKGREAQLHYGFVRYLLILRRLDKGYTYAETGEELGISRQRVEQILRKGRETVRRHSVNPRLILLPASCRGTVDDGGTTHDRNKTGMA
jgi:DNA-directed RNA polymerase sigma subunit (sigma70/sigma32)